MKARTCVLILGVAAGALGAFGERLTLQVGASRCVVETRGARVLSYVPAGGRDVLWNADPVQIEDADWAHGGIPVCWPNFGLDNRGKFHGFAWKREFAVVRRTKSDARSELELELVTPEARLSYRIVLTDESLKLSLGTRNLSSHAFSFRAALHPYFRVSERDAVKVSGIRDAPYAVTRSIDEVFLGTKCSCDVYRLADPGLNRTLSLYAENTDGVCVWNPGPEKDCPGTIPGDEWRRYVCLEPAVGIGGENASVRLAPGEDSSFSFEIRPRRSSAVTGFAGRDSRYPDAADKGFRLPFRAMFIGAHPDDAEYDFGALAAKLVAAGAKVTFVSVCNGDNGHQTMDPKALAARRYRETQASARTYGIERYIVMGEHDCIVEPTVDLRRRVTRLIREFEPNMVVTHRTCDYHADHRATGQVVQDSTYLLGVPLFAPETPVPEVLPFVLYAGDQFTVPRPIRPDLVVDGEDVLDTMVRVLACHESQLFEWLPPEFGVDPSAIPQDEKGRLDFIRRHAMADLKRDGEQHRRLVSRLFGGEDVRCVNVFEICEYSRPPTDRERAYLAAIPGSRWTDGQADGK